MSGQLWQTIRQEISGLDDKIRGGSFSQILAWLRSRIHEPGRRYLPGDLIRRATGQPLSSQPYLDYLQTKYTEIYALS
jgi:carboxypeptidase Taq